MTLVTMCVGGKDKEDVGTAANANPSREAAKEIMVHTSSLFNSKDKCFVSNITLVIDTESGLITKVYRREGGDGDKLTLISSYTPRCSSQADWHYEDEEDEYGAAAEATRETLDLRGLTVLPGLVDSHAHVFLHEDTPSLHQMRDESVVERVVRATNHARAALDAGFTTYRDLGTEGLGDADARLRDTINRGLTPGPRMFVATECIASSAGYETRRENGDNPGTGLQVPRISDPADGVDGVRAAVRRRLGAGADIVKFYADYRKRPLRFPEQTWKGGRDIQFPPPAGAFDNERNPNVLLFTQEEMDTMVAEARASGSPVAAHAQSPPAVIMAARAGVTTVEHGYIPSAEARAALRENDVIFVPTLSVFELYYAGAPMRAILRHVKAAFDEGVRIAAGGDTGTIAHGDNARELEHLASAGIPIPDILQAATLRGWEACGGDLCGRRFGVLEAGYAADIVAVEGDFSVDLAAIRKIRFVMKDGIVYKDRRA